MVAVMAVGRRLDDECERAACANKRHALDEQAQRLPVDARDDAQVISGMPKKARRSAARASAAASVPLTLVCSRARRCRLVVVDAGDARIASACRLRMKRKR